MSPSGPSDLTRLLNALDPGAGRAERHLWLVDLLAWVRAGMGEGDDPAGAVARVRLLLDAVQARPEWLPRWHAWWQLFKDTVDPAPLLADFGFAPRTAFLSDLGDRLRRKLLPVTPDTYDLITLFDLLLPDPRDTLWLKALDVDTLDRVQHLLFDASTDEVWGHAVLMDALTYSVGQVSAAGFSSEIRSRMAATVSQAHPYHTRPFHALPGQFEAFKAAVKADGARGPLALAGAQALREQLDACRHAAYTVYAHLDENGISVGIVFRLSQLRERMVRIKQLLDCLQSENPAQSTARLLAQLAQVGQAKRSIRALITSSTHMTAAKVAERNAESGEHYITRNAAEYRHMLGTAAGGGAVLAFTTWAKFGIYGLGLSAFWSGLAFGMNYAISFVIVMLLHWTVATKQPAVTAPAMAARLKDMSAPDAMRNFIDEVAHLLRSQIAAIIGNLGLVIPGVLLICAGADAGRVSRPHARCRTRAPCAARPDAARAHGPVRRLHRGAAVCLQHHRGLGGELVRAVPARLGHRLEPALHPSAWQGARPTLVNMAARQHLGPGGQHLAGPDAGPGARLCRLFRAGAGSAPRDPVHRTDGRRSLHPGAGRAGQYRHSGGPSPALP